MQGTLPCFNASQHGPVRFDSEELQDPPQYPHHDESHEKNSHANEYRDHPASFGPAFLMSLRAAGTGLCRGCLPRWDTASGLEPGDPGFFGIGILRTHVFPLIDPDDPYLAAERRIDGHDIEQV